MTIAVVAVITAFLAAFLRRSHPEQAMAVTLIAGVLMVAAALTYVVPLIGDVQQMLDAGGLPREYTGILFKALGICVITQLAADACRDAGEQGLASKAEFVGKLMLLALALPMFQKIGEVAVSLIERG